MALEPGVRLGPYEVVSLRGQGGMGEVYRGRDVRLDRDVAIKVLRRDATVDPVSRQRFQREAKTISQLRHPHICTLYDIGSDQGVDYLVMEYLEGPTLEDRLSRGALPLDDVVAIGGQIAEAMAAAHDAGVVHRDLKPGNVMLTRDGAKVLDFGLAKGSEAPAAAVDGESPTVTQPLTTAGSLLGTLLYMAPEQLEGKPADARSDLWALGAVLYQMATGARPFTGGSQASLMASILTASPRAVSELQPETPARLAWLIERCLEKVPERRWQSARDLALELRSLAEVNESPLPTTTGGSRRRSMTMAIVAAVGMMVGLAVGAFLWPRLGDETGGPESEAWTTTVLESTDAGSPTISMFDISPDGRTALVAKWEAGRHRFYRRDLDSLDSVRLSETFREPGSFSPDRRQLAVVDSQRRLRTMPLGGEPGASLAENVMSTTLWGEDGYIYYMASEWPPKAWRVRATGGEPEPVEAGVATDLLPGGGTLLTTRIAGPYESTSVTVMGVDVGTGDSRELTPGGWARYVEPGFLTFCRDGALWAAPIEVATGELVAPARSIEEVGESGPPFHECWARSSRSGNLLYSPRRETGQYRLVWVARDGKVEPITAEIKDFSSPLPSLDGRYVSVQAGGPADDGQWTLDLSSGSWSRQAQSSGTSAAQWVPPEGRVIVFFSNRDDAGGRMFVQPADRSAPPKVLWPTERPHRSLDVSSDGRHFILIFLDAHAEGFFVLDRSTGEVRTVSEEGAIRSADFHRDGDWIVYSREERPGYANLWLVPFPGPGEPRQITFEGGVQPQWSLDGSEIFYRGPGYFSAITVEKSGGTLVTGRPRPLFEDRFRETYPGTLLNYSQHPTGRFLMIESAQGDSLVLVENWRAKVVQAFARDDGE